MNPILRFFWFCSGVNQSMLKKCPTDAPKYFGIGATIFFTGVFAFISCTYAIIAIFKSLPGAIIFGFLWGCMIFNLDRYIVGSMKKKDSFWPEFKIAIPRLIMAILLALVISKPLELKIFEPEIAAELILMEQKIYKEQEQKIGDRFAEKIKNTQEEINKLKSEIALQETKRDTLMIIAQQEADGTGGSKQKNLGPIYKAKKTDADKSASMLDSLIAHHQPLISEKQKALAQLDSTVTAEITNLNRGRYDGLAARMEALSHLTQQSWAIMLANWLIIFLFISIETAPIFVKLISDRSPYDNLLMAHEHSFEVFRKEQIAKLDHQMEKRISGLKDRRAEPNPNLVSAN